MCSYGWGITDLINGGTRERRLDQILMVSIWVRDHQIVKPVVVAKKVKDIFTNGVRLA